MKKGPNIFLKFGENDRMIEVRVEVHASVVFDKRSVQLMEQPNTALSLTLCISCPYMEGLR